MRIVFVNLHGNEFLVKTLNKYIFKQSVAIKHKYFLDYLLSRPEVDATRVGVHGTSGGGTLTTWVTAVDDRITMSAPSCSRPTDCRNVRRNPSSTASITETPPSSCTACWWRYR